MIKMGEEEYLRKNAENAQKWRDNNPEKCKENNENKKNNISYHYSNYQRTANYKNVAFELTEDEFNNIVKDECNYCGEFSDGKKFNGIDRKDQMIGYILNNCVACCEMCNYMKKSLNEDIFLERVEHILKYNNLIQDGIYYPDAFANHFSVNYDGYKKKANLKQFVFQLTTEQFYNIINNPCYICGKLPSPLHKNGIDRFDSNIGYVLENCRCCCGECNYMKNNYEYDAFINKLKLIYERYNTKPSTNQTNNDIIKTEEINIIENQLKKEPMKETLIIRENRIMVKSNKKTPQQLKEEAAERKRKQRLALKERYGDEEYKKTHAKNIAEQRKKQKEIIGEEEYNRIQAEKMAKYRLNKEK
jgi:hypothetical protein